jgi:hypothetical protein
MANVKTKHVLDNGAHATACVDLIWRMLKTQVQRRSTVHRRDSRVADRGVLSQLLQNVTVKKRPELLRVVAEGMRPSPLSVAELL